MELPRQIKSPKTGRMVTVGKDAYKKLLTQYPEKYLLGIENPSLTGIENPSLTGDLKLNEFNSFQQLPTELQSLIFSEDDAMLIQSQMVNKFSRKITQQAFVQNICNKPISNQEIENYISHYLPEHIYFFYEDRRSNAPNIVHMGAMKYTLIDADNIKDYTYHLTYEIIEQVEHLMTYTIVKSKEYKKIPLYKDRTPDLLTTYFIYKNRKCDDIKANFSKNKILTLLQSKYDKLYIDNYISLLSLYLYIKVNLLCFPVLVTNPFIGYLITDDTIIKTPNNINLKYEDFINDLFVNIDQLYEILITQINKLD